MAAYVASHRGIGEIRLLDHAALERLGVPLIAASVRIDYRWFNVCAHKSIRGDISNECLECDHADIYGSWLPGTEKALMPATTV